MLTRITPRLLLVGLLTCALAALPATFDAPAAARAGEPVTLLDLGTLGGGESAASDINERGQVVGYSITADGRQHAFLWDRGTMRDLGTLGGSWSNAAAVNDSGQVVGTSQDEDGVERAFLWERGVMRDLGTPAGAQSAAQHVNAQGQVTVTAFVDGGLRGYVWDRGVLTELDAGVPAAFTAAEDINDDGWVLAHHRTADETDGHPLMWRDGVVVDLEASAPPGSQVVGRVLDEAGRVAVHLTLPGEPTVAALWEDGVWSTLGALGSSSYVQDLNERGTVAGFARYDNFDHHAVLYRDGEVIDLHELAPGWEDSVAFRLNDREQVIGSVDRYSGGGGAVLWQDGEMHLLPPLVPGGGTRATDINERGQIAGSATTGTADDTHAVLWTAARGS